jgi:hypothetical protein
MEQNDNMHNIQQLLSNVQNIAIVGAKDKPSQPVNEVGRYLIQAGFTIFPVHPQRQNVWGLPTYPNLVDIPERIDLVVRVTVSLDTNLG